MKANARADLADREPFVILRSALNLTNDSLLELKWPRHKLLKFNDGSDEL
jgi:hypothetical protein